MEAAHDPNWYPTGVKITDAELAAVFCPSKPTTSTANGTTPSSLNQSRRQALTRALLRIDARYQLAPDNSKCASDRVGAFEIALNVEHFRWTQTVD